MTSAHVTKNTTAITSMQRAGAALYSGSVEPFARTNGRSTKNCSENAHSSSATVISAGIMFSATRFVSWRLRSGRSSRSRSIARSSISTRPQKETSHRTAHIIFPR